MQNMLEAHVFYKMHVSVVVLTCMNYTKNKTMKCNARHFERWFSESFVNNEELFICG